MNYANVLREIGRGGDEPRDLPADVARDLFAAMLDGGVPDLELGAIMTALSMKAESVDELLGFLGALESRLIRLSAAERPVRPAVIPSYGGARELPNLLPLLALLLKHYGVPVLIHGMLESHGRVTTGHVLRELGIMPCATAHAANEKLAHDGIAFVPIAALAPGLASLLALRVRLGLRNSAHVVAKLIDPFTGPGGPGVCIVPHGNPTRAKRSRAVLASIGAEALVLAGTEGEAFTNPRRRCRIDHIRNGVSAMLFDEEAAPAQPGPSLPEGTGAKQTADWIRRAFAGAVPVPHPILNQVACCLFACGYTENFSQAKAIVAIESGHHATA
jgi:anthranilate phosphoribosyltransferase